LEPAHFGFIIIIPLLLFLFSFFLPKKRRGDHNV
jgi:hypothetical protein